MPKSHPLSPSELHWIACFKFITRPSISITKSTIFKSLKFLISNLIFLGKYIWRKCCLFNFSIHYTCFFSQISFFTLFNFLGSHFFYMLRSYLSIFFYSINNENFILNPMLSCSLHDIKLKFVWRFVFFIHSKFIHHCMVLVGIVLFRWFFDFHWTFLFSWRSYEFFGSRCYNGPSCG